MFVAVLPRLICRKIRILRTDLIGMLGNIGDDFAKPARHFF